MSYAVLHIAKSGGSCNAIAKHIERKTSPDNAHPELAYLNRDDFIKYPDGVGNLTEAVQFRLDHAGLNRKVGKNQVLALHVLLTSDGEALKRISDEGHLDEWADASIQWAKDTFGEDNVVGAHLHMDEATPHLHVTVVPIVTTERKKKASEAKAKKRYRTKAKNGPRLSADDIMTRENLTRFQDTYAEAMKRFGLERGVRGSEARHVDQHEYYRQCQIEKKGLEQDVAKLTTEKKKLGKEKKTLESNNAQLHRENNSLENRKTVLESNVEMVKLNVTKQQQTRDTLIKENAGLETRGKALEDVNSKLGSKTCIMTDKLEALEDSIDKALQKKSQASSETVDDIRLLKKFYPDVMDMLPAIRDCEQVQLSDKATKMMLDGTELVFNPGAKLYDPIHDEMTDVSNAKICIKRDPADGNKFHLFLGGMRVLQWLKQKWESLKKNIRTSFRHKF